MVKSFLCGIMAIGLFQQTRLPARDYFVVGSNSMQRVYYETSSNSSVNHDGRLALDGDTATAWISRKSDGPQWLQIDYGSKRLISKIVVYPGRKDNYRTVRYLVLQFLYRGEWFDFAEVPLLKKALFGRGESFLDRVEIDVGGVDASTFRIFFPAGSAIDGYAAITEVETWLGSNKIICFDPRLNNLFLPIRNAFLPESDAHYPTAPRNYRGGVHAGIDIYYHYTDESYSPIAVNFSTPVYAVSRGRVIRADWDHRVMSQEEWRDQSAYSQVHEPTFVKLSFGGRQVWIDHGNGIVTAYNHLSKIDKSIQAGREVGRGQRLGWAGNSGLWGETLGNQDGCHLHLEIWIDGRYLGYGMDVADIRKYFSWIFSVSE